MSVAEAPLLVSEHDAILEVTLNRPDKLNTLSRALLAKLDAAITAFRTKSELRVMLIRATGRYFCAGADLIDSSMPDFGGSPLAVRNWYRTEMNGMQRMWDELEAIEKPIVVAHHAACLGGGLEMSLSCDFRLAAASATYGFPEANFGMIPASGGVSRLTRLVGPHWARWLVMANKPVDANRALIMGLVHEVYPDATFEAEVMDFCRHIAKQPPEAVAVAKRTIELCADVEAAQARQIERLAVSGLTYGREFEELFAKTLERLSAKKTDEKGNG